MRLDQACVRCVRIYLFYVCVKSTYHEFYYKRPESKAYEAQNIVHDRATRKLRHRP